MTDTRPTQNEMEQADYRPAARRVHMFLSPKGGVGKSFSARILTEYLSATAYDADENNKTLSQFQGLNSFSVNLMNVDTETGIAHGTVGAINVASVDEFVRHLIDQQQDRDTVIDFGSHQYAPMLEYLLESAFVEVLREYGIETWIHILVCGGTSQTETVNALVEITNRFLGMPREGLPICVYWQNEYFGEIQLDDVDAEDNTIHDVESINPGRYFASIENLPQWSKIRRLFKGGVVLQKRSGIFNTDLEYLQISQKTFARMLDDPHTPIMARSRLQRIWNDLDEQLNAVFRVRKIRPNLTQPTHTDETLRQLGDAKKGADMQSATSESDTTPVTQEPSTVTTNPLDPDVSDGTEDDVDSYGEPIYADSDDAEDNEDWHDGEDDADIEADEEF